MSNILIAVLIITVVVGINAHGYEEYSGSSNYGSSDIVKAPALPIEPPRVTAEEIGAQSANNYFENSDPNSINEQSVKVPSLSYHPPPPPTIREVESISPCSYDKSKWEVEPQSAVGSAIMFDRTTGLTCEQCLQKCITEHQDSSSLWVCRSLTYDHEFKICDLYAINGKDYPYYLTDFESRDYFAYTAASQSISSEQLSVRPKPASSSSSASSAQGENAKGTHSSGLTPVSITHAPSLPTTSTSAPTTIEFGDEVNEESTSGAPSITELLTTVNEIQKNIQISSSSPYPESTDSEVDSVPVKSYAAKTQQFSEKHSERNSTSEERHSVSHKRILNIQSLDGVQSTSTMSSVVVEEEANVGSQLSDFETALKSLKKQAETDGNERRIESDTNSSLVTITEGEEIHKPSQVKILKTNSFASPTHESTLWRTLSSSIHTIPISGGTSDSEQQQARSSMQESKSFKTSSSSSSSSTFSSSSLSKSSSSTKFSTSNSSSAADNSNFNRDAQLHRSEGVTSFVQSSSDTEGSSSCNLGDLSRFILFDGYERSREDELNRKQFPAAKSMEECVEACDLQQLLHCTSVVYSTVSGCELFASSVDHSNGNSLTPQSNSKYVEKSCIPSLFAQGIAKISPAVPQHILVGHVQEVTDASSFVECQISCLRSESDFGFVCKSAMWYPQDKDQNCLLNAENRFTQPEVFVSEDPGVVMTYFELTPENSLKSNTLQQLLRFRDAPLHLEKSNESLKFDSAKAWTHWSNCKYDELYNSAVRVRYFKCTEHKDVRKCPKESTVCGNASTLHIQKITKLESNERGRPITTESTPTITEKIANESDCRAVRDALGRKHCPYGMKTVNGQREFCRNPVDC